MHYYVDGYNLLFRILQVGDNLKTQRKEATVDLEMKIHQLKLKATLVFDSHFQEDDSTRTHYKSLEVIFTAKGETADDFILKKLKESPTPGEYTVVTSDKKLAYLCRILQGKTESVEDFLGWLNKRYKNQLRRSKIPSKQIPETTPPVKTAVQSKLPSANTALENCFDYYLDLFEKESQQLAKEAPKSKTKKTESKKLKQKLKPVSPEEEHLSDMQRWLKAFDT